MTDDNSEVRQDRAPLVADGYFAIIPELLIYAEVSDRAFRLYAYLARKADKRGSCWPSRATIAEVLRCSKESVDRAVKELAEAGAITVERRFDTERNQWLATRYTVMRVSSQVTRGSRVGATTPSRVGDEGVAAPVTTEVKPLNERNPPTPRTAGGSGLRATGQNPRAVAARDEAQYVRTQLLNDCEQFLAEYPEDQELLKLDDTQRRVALIDGLAEVQRQGRRVTITGVIVCAEEVLAAQKS